MPPFMLLVKPASADCNLRCEYCFYLEKCGIYPGSITHRMTAEILDRTIASYMATDQPTYTFCWQGGEPTLMGVDFFRRITDLQQQHGRPGSVVANSLQTNAVAIDDEMAGHFGRYKFLVGCSLDGPAEIHDRYRVTAAGSPTHARVVRGIEALRRHRVAINVLVLVSRANVRRAREVYRYLIEQGHDFQQYIPCVEFDRGGQLRPFAIGAEEWGDFLCTLFDEWIAGDTSRVSVRHFDALLRKLVDGRSTLCTIDDNCCQYFVVEHNGDVYPCDFFVQPHLRLGNILETDWDRLRSARKYRQFGAQKSAWNEQCRSCEQLDLCGGDCLKHRLRGDDRPGRLSHLCTGWKRFLNHARPRLGELAQEIRRRGHEAPEPLPADPGRPGSSAKTAGRNDPCPCGSGLKHKKCCLE